LIIWLKKVESGCQIQMLNLSAKPDADWKCREDVLHIRINSTDCGRVVLVIGDKEAKRLGIKPGDVLGVSQDDAEGRGSPSETLLLPQRHRFSEGFRLTHEDALVNFGGPQFRIYGTYYLALHKDQRPPAYVTRLMKISREGAGGVLTGSRAVEPQARV